MNKFTNILLKLSTGGALLAMSLIMNTVCHAWGHQDKEPMAAQKYNRFK